MDKPRRFLLGIVLCIVLLRLSLASLHSGFTYESYFHLRQVEHITQTGLPLYQDALSYGGRELFFLPLFHYLAAFFDLFLPLEIVGKLLPNILLASLVPLVYLIARELGKSALGSLFAAGIAGFLPVLFTPNAFTPQSLFLPSLFLAVYAFLKIQQKEVEKKRQKRKYFYFYLFAFLFSSLTSPATVLLLLGFGLYFLISLAERQNVSRDEFELCIASTFFYLWVQLLFFHDLIKKEGISFIWQNIPTAILSEYFPHVSVSHGIILVSVIPLVTGIFVLYRVIFSAKEPKAHLLLGLAAAAILFLFLRFIPLKSGLSFLGILLAILFANFYDDIFPFLQKTKLAFNASKVTAFLILLLLLTTVYPALSTAQQQDLPSEEELGAFNWLKTHLEKEATVLALTKEGHLITALGKRKNVMDDQFSLQDDAEQRFVDVNLLYQTSFQTQALHLLEKYSAKYILFTPHAQQQYQLKRLRYLTPDCFHLVYHQNNIKIYERKCTLEKK